MVSCSLASPTRCYARVGHPSVSPLRGLLILVADSTHGLRRGLCSVAADAALSALNPPEATSQP